MTENLTRTDYCAQCGANFIAVHLPWAHTYVIGCRRCGTVAETVEELALAELPQEQGERLWARLRQLLAREETSEREEWRFGDTLNLPDFT